MKAILVYPRLNYDGYGEPQEPLGLLYIAQTLRDAGHQVGFVDLTFSKDLDSLSPALADADLVGISGSTSLYDKALLVLEHVRSQRPELPVIMGGPHATVCTERVLKDGFDLVVVGEGEKTAVEVADAIEQGKPLKGIAGTAVLEDGKVITGPQRPFVHDLNSISLPARDLLDYGEYFENGLIHIGLMATRGCPHNCLFCKPMQNKLFGHKVRGRSAENVFEDILKAIELTGKTWFLFRDDTLMLMGIEWFKELARLRSEHGIDNLYWTCQARVDQVTPQMLRAMKDGGMVGMAFGVESGSQKILDFYRKRITPEKTIRAFDLCREFGIGTHAFIMLGAPPETKADLQATVDLVERIKPNSIGISVTTPAPGTDLFEYAKQNNLISMSSDLEADYMKNATPMNLPHLTVEDISETANKLLALVPKPMFDNQLKKRIGAIKG